ncbi:hypothetical protein JNL27_07455, partial [bacterium]|nr:hypothetical protein [bacterium]
MANQEKNTDSSKQDYQSHLTNNDSPNELNAIDLLYILIPWKKKIILTTLIVMILTVGITFIMDKWYESKAVILLPEKSASALESLGGALGGLGQSLLGSAGTSGPQRYIAILKSRRLKEAVIDKFDLIHVFDKKPALDDTLSLIELMDEMIISESNTKNGTITVTVRCKGDADKIAEMTNFVVSTLDEINRELSTEQAKSSRL